MGAKIQHLKYQMLRLRPGMSLLSAGGLIRSFKSLSRSPGAVPVRRESYLKLKMPHSKHEMPYPKLNTPHSRPKMAHSKWQERCFWPEIGDLRLLTAD